jgi:hypothetical protein
MAEPAGGGVAADSSGPDSLDVVSGGVRSVAGRRCTLSQKMTLPTLGTRRQSRDQTRAGDEEQAGLNLERPLPTLLSTVRGTVRWHM